MDVRVAEIRKPVRGLPLAMENPPFELAKHHKSSMNGQCYHRYITNNQSEEKSRPIIVT